MKLEREAVTFPAGGIQLEGILGRAKGTRDAPAVAICHPHPLMGGSMDNNVVMGLFSEFVSRGYVALAFNFRGTGRSGGTHEGGQGEILDVLAAMDYLEGLSATSAHKIALAGYSFGAWIALQAVVRAEGRVRCAGVVAPPVEMLPFDFLVRCPGPLFFVWGDRDPFCPTDKMLRLLAEMPGPPPPRWILDGGDHFLVGVERKAAAYLCDGFAPHLQPRSPGV